MDKLDTPSTELMFESPYNVLRSGQPSQVGPLLESPHYQETLWATIPLLFFRSLWTLGGTLVLDLHFTGLGVSPLGSFFRWSEYLLPDF